MKNVSTIPAIALAVTGLASAQGLYNIQPYDDEPLDPSPIRWTAGVSIGYDDNATPTGSELPGGTESDSAFVAGFVQGSYVSVQPQTTWDAWGRIGASYYFDQVPNTAGGGNEDVFYDLGLGFNVVHRATERLRFRSRNNISYQVEPDRETSLGADLRQGQYIRYSTDNSVGYSWTERFGTVTGFRFFGVTYDDLDQNDFFSTLLYNQFRYRLSPATVLTGSYRYQDTDNDTGRDSNAHFVLVGAEHRFSPTTVGVFRAGAQFFDGAGSSTAPYVEATLRTQVNEQFSLRGFVRYGIEDRGTNLQFSNVPGVLISGFYDERTTFRLGTQATYVVSPDITLFGGANVVFIEYDDLLPGGVGGPPGSFDEETFNFNIGASYRVAENVFINGTYNYTHADADGLSREYDRNRFNLGVRTTF